MNETQKNTLTAFDFRMIDAVANMTGIKYTIAIGMSNSKPIYVQEWIDVIRSNVHLSNIVGIEVGNEPGTLYILMHYNTRLMLYQIIVQCCYHNRLILNS